MEFEDRSHTWAICAGRYKEASVSQVLYLVRYGKGHNAKPRPSLNHA